MSSVYDKLFCCLTCGFIRHGLFKFFEFFFVEKSVGKTCNKGFYESNVPSHIIVAQQKIVGSNLINAFFI